MLTCPRCEGPLSATDWLCTGCGLDITKVVRAPRLGPLDGVWLTPGPHNLDPYRPLERWTAAWRSVLFVTAGVAMVLAAVLCAATLAHGHFHLPIPAATEQLSVQAVQVLGPAVAFLGILAIVIAVGWTNRAYRNLPALGVESFRFSPDVVAGGWLVPGVNVVVPPLALLELWRSSDPTRPPHAGGASRGPVGVPIKEAWAMVVLGIPIAAVGWLGLGSPEGWSTTFSRPAAMTATLGLVLAAIGFLLLTVVADSIAERQRTRAARLGPPPAVARFRGQRAIDLIDPVDPEADPAHAVQHAEPARLGDLVAGSAVFGRY